MASAMLLASCWLLFLQVSWSVGQQNCPVVNSIFPPSGTVETEFLISGTNLDRLSEITIDIGTSRTIPVSNTNAAHYHFTIGGTLLSVPGPLMFTAVHPTCVIDSIQLDLRERKYIVVLLLWYLWLYVLLASINNLCDDISALPEH